MGHLLEGRAVGPQVGQHQFDAGAVEATVAVQRPAHDLGETVGLLVDVAPAQRLRLVLKVGTEGHGDRGRIGGAAIEGSITTADGQVLPVRYDWYSNSIADVRGYTTWYDADRAYQRLASRLADGRYVSR